MAAVCPSCSRNLSMLERIARKEVCGQCTDAARRELTQRLAQIDDHSTDVAAIRADVDEIVARGRLRGKDLATLKNEALKEQIRQVLDDLVLTVAEENRIRRVMMVLDIDDDAMMRDYREDAYLLAAAKINSGRMPTLTPAPILLKSGEIAHLELTTELIKEVVQRETRTTFNGVSARVGGGVTLRSGEARSRSVVVGRTLEPTDKGKLVVTSHRTVFTGVRTSVEIPHKKLLSIDTFTDGIRVHVANRATPPMFKVGTGEGWVASATMLQAAQHLLT